MPLGTEVGLGPSDVLDGDPAPSKRGEAPTHTFRPMSIVAERSVISATAEHLFDILRPLSPSITVPKFTNFHQRINFFSEIPVFGLSFFSRQNLTFGRGSIFVHPYPEKCKAIPSAVLDGQ